MMGNSLFIVKWWIKDIIFNPCDIILLKNKINLIVKIRVVVSMSQNTFSWQFEDDWRLVCFDHKKTFVSVDWVYHIKQTSLSISVEQSFCHSIILHEIETDRPWKNQVWEMAFLSILDNHLVFRIFIHLHWMN